MPTAMRYSLESFGEQIREIFAGHHFVRQFGGSYEPLSLREAAETGGSVITVYAAMKMALARLTDDDAVELVADIMRHLVPQEDGEPLNQIWVQFAEYFSGRLEPYKSFHRYSEIRKRVLDIEGEECFRSQRPLRGDWTLANLAFWILPVILLPYAESALKQPLGLEPHPNLAGEGWQLIWQDQLAGPTSPAI